MSYPLQEKPLLADHSAETDAAPMDTASFQGMIGPRNLLSLVRNTANFIFEGVSAQEDSTRLIERGSDPTEFKKILLHAEHLKLERLPLEEAYQEYFALCLAAHHATVATFVPTDVDSKIRGTLWYKVTQLTSVQKMFAFTERALVWSLTGLSTRADEFSGVGPVSGHNGEILGVLAGGLGAFVHHGEEALAEHAAEVIDAELWREAKEFLHVCNTPGLEVNALRLSASLTHNVGDLNQGIGYWQASPQNAPYVQRFSRLAQEKVGVYDNAYQHAVALYRAVMAKEGHRHYPLRGVPALRRSAELLLPLSPFLDEWGTKVAQSKVLTDEEKGEVLHALIQGCRKIEGQIGYYRALVGMQDGFGGSFDRVISLIPHASRKLLKEAKFRKELSVKRASFESSMRKLATEILVSRGVRKK